MTETPPQSGSGGKEQTRSKAAKKPAGSSLHSAGSISVAGADNEWVTGKARARFLTAFARSKAVLAERGRFVMPLGGGGQDSHESEVRN